MTTRRRTVAAAVILPPATRADKALARAAAALPAVARAGDEAGVARIIEGLAPWQAARLVMILAAAADRDEVMAAAGLADETVMRAASAKYRQLLKLGVPARDMPPEVTEAVRMYKKLAMRRWRAGAAA